VDIADTGSGVAPEHVHNIFEEFVSIENSGDRSGTGLGLAISKLVVRAHHGHIWAEAHPDGGRFSFVIPYHRPVAVEYAETGSAAIVGAA
jgi:signal transduction histidine kinase